VSFGLSFFSSLFVPSPQCYRHDIPPPFFLEVRADVRNFFLLPLPDRVRIPCLSLHNFGPPAVLQATPFFFSVDSIFSRDTYVSYLVLTLSCSESPYTCSILLFDSFQKCTPPQTESSACLSHASQLLPPSPGSMDGLSSPPPW